MKKCYTFSAALLFLSAAASAQRMVDLQCTLVSPAAGSTINSGAATNIRVLFKNVGTTTLKTTDTFGYILLVDNNAIKDASNNPIGDAFTNYQMLPNDTVSASLSLSLSFSSSANGSHNFCATAVLLNRSADSVKDNVTANNTGCSQVTFAGSNVGVNTIVGSRNRNSVISTYPVPARNEASFDLFLTGSSRVIVRVTDLAGRTISLQDKGMINAGKQTITVDVNNAPTGMYLYQVQMGSETSTGKLNILK